MGKTALKDVAPAIIVLISLIVISVVIKYNTGLLIGSLVLFVLLSSDHIKKIVLEMNVRKIYGIEFGEREKELIKEKVREEVGKSGVELTANQIDAVTDAAFNQIIGVANKGAYYEETVLFALKDSGVDFVRNLSGAVGNSRFSVDFVVQLDDCRVLGIEAAYSESRYLTETKIDDIISKVSTFKRADNVSHFVVITNAEIKEEDKRRLAGQQPRIDVIESTVSPDGVISKLDAYSASIDRSRKGSLEKKG